MQGMGPFRYFRTSVIGLCAAGTLMVTGCDEQLLNAMTAALEAAAQQLGEEDDDISFGDWLSDELEDL